MARVSEAQRVAVLTGRLLAGEASPDEREELQRLTQARVAREEIAGIDVEVEALMSRRAELLAVVDAAKPKRGRR